MNRNTAYLMLILLIFSVQVSYSKGLFGSYVVYGKVYDSRGNLLKNQLLTVYDGKKDYRIHSDENGNYSFKVFYGTACRSVYGKGSLRKTNKLLNTRSLLFSYGAEQAEIRTNWKRGARAGKINHRLQLKQSK